MAKTVKLVLFGVPGVGKSTFASKAPNPLFICTDGNGEWLDLPEKNHVRVSTWKQAKDIINNIVVGKPEYKDYETIVVDLIEDLYVWAEDEFCKREGIIHIGDYKSMGAGYSVVRKEFFAQISKLLSIDKHVILVSHEADKVGKTKAGADTYTYIPSDKMSLTKQWNDIEGQVRYFLRCFSQDVEEAGRIRKKRYLSLIPGQGEYGICRGADEENWPRECELDWNVFTSIIGLDSTPAAAPAPQPTPAPAKEEAKPAPKKIVRPAPKPAPAPVKEEPKPEPVEEAPAEETPAVEEVADEPVMSPARPDTDEPVQEAAPAPQPEPEPAVVVSEPVKENIDTSKLSSEERRRIVLERMKAMKNR